MTMAYSTMHPPRTGMHQHQSPHHGLSGFAASSDHNNDHTKRPRLNSWQPSMPTPPSQNNNISKSSIENGRGISATDGGHENASTAGVDDEDMTTDKPHLSRSEQGNTTLPGSSKMVYPHGFHAQAHRSEQEGSLTSNVSPHKPSDIPASPTFRSGQSNPPFLPPRPVSVPLPGERPHHHTRSGPPSEASSASDTSATTPSHFHHHHHQAPSQTGTQVYMPQQPFPSHNLVSSPVTPQAHYPPGHVAHPAPGQFHHHHPAGVVQQGYIDSSAVTRSSDGMSVAVPGVNGPIIKEEASPTVEGMNFSAAMYLNPPQQPQQRKKASRATQACDACRSRKAKCDEGRPSCGFCLQNNHGCVYREVPIPKQDRTMLAMQSSIDRLEKAQNTKIIDKLERILKFMEDGAYPGSSQTQGSSSRTFSTQEDAPGQVQNVKKEEDEELSHPRSYDALLTIPLEHTTPAHKLLGWPSVKYMLDNTYAENYVIDGELNRETLHIHGRGEGKDGTEDDDDEVNESGNMYNDRYQQMNNIYPGGGIGLKARNGLHLDADIFSNLLDNFLKNIHILHPFLDETDLKNSLAEFQEKYGSRGSFGVVAEYSEQDTEEDGDSYVHTYMQSQVPQNMSPQNSFGPVHSFAQPQRMAETSPYQSHQGFNTPSFAPASSSPGRGYKRKRTSVVQPPQRTAPCPPGMSQTSDFMPYGAHSKNVAKTLKNALCLLVLALGDITGHRAPIPGPLPPATSSADNMSNIDIIPGLAYFSKALDIMGNYNGSNQLIYVQAALLAGLYWGQMGRVLDSWRWISNACMACQLLIRRIPSEDDANRDADQSKLRQLYLRVYWSCLQLESDVLAELDLPPSGISRLEEKMPYPRNDCNPVDDPDRFLMWAYFHFQCSIRKTLNQVHSDLYKKEKKYESVTKQLNMAKHFDNHVEQWRASLPPPLQWDDREPPSNNINAARLRAKYYGAKYIIHRPFLNVFIHDLFTDQNGDRSSVSPPISNSELAHSSPSSGTAVTPTANPEKLRNGIHEKWPGRGQSMYEHCKKCIDAAIASTRAFHAFNPRDTNRPVLTNIFGTAHAQFGNMLVLQAVFHDERHRLSRYLTPGLMQELIKRTIDFLDSLSNISATLKQDALILKDASTKFDARCTELGLENAYNS